MKIIESESEMRAAIKEAKSANKVIGMIMTTGNLHHGHMELVTELRKTCSFIVVSNMTEDKNYASRNVSTEADAALLHTYGADVLFAPCIFSMYKARTRGQASSMSRVTVPSMRWLLCGSLKLNVMESTCTCFVKFFNIIQPDVTIFGEKDYLQYAIVRKLVEDLNFPVKVQSHAVIRDSTGLAVASRNRFLNDDELLTAAGIFKTLCYIKTQLEDGNEEYEELEELGRAELIKHGLTVDYFTILDEELNTPTIDTDLILFVSANVGKEKLVDTMRVKIV